MKSLFIQFNRKGAILDLENAVEGFNAVNQDALVNIGTKVGSDGISDIRGSSLEALGLGTTSIISLRDAAHLGNVVGAETDLYITEDEDPEEEDSLQAIDLQPIKLELQTLELNVISTSVNGESIGVAAPLLIK